jgi:hypothetical protein
MAHGLEQLAGKCRTSPRANDDRSQRLEIGGFHLRKRDVSTIEECEREFTETARAFSDTAIAGGHSLESAKAMARDVVAR